jgi:hypothetical protein
MKCDRLFAKHAKGIKGQWGKRMIYFDIVKFHNYSDQKWLVCDMDRAKSSLRLQVHCGSIMGILNNLCSISVTQ